MAGVIKREQQNEDYVPPQHSKKSLKARVAPQLATAESVQNSRSNTIEHDAVMSDLEQLPTPASDPYSTDNEQNNSQAGSTLLSNMDTPPEHDAMHALGTHSRRLIQVIQQLGNLGIDATLPSLPKFVVVGDQSAGKSSIVEALCNIMLPRSSGTCTRCPFLITTTATKDGEPWSCVVSLQSKYNYDRSCRGQLYKHWTEQRVVTTHFATVDHKSRLGDVLQRAQRALLNPHDDPRQYINSSHNQESQVGFSPNVVGLHITGPELPDLSFYDLPGSINVVEDDKDQHLVDFVEQLVKSYLYDENALILLACASDVDIENSTTFKFVRHCHAELRCLGVLTKPDLIQRARLSHVARMLEGKVFKLGRGWFVTKQPSQTQLDAGVSQADARQLEQNFFSGELWTNNLANYASRFGIPVLQESISTELRRHIIACLPDIIERVQARLNAVEADLTHFREKDAHPWMTINKVITNINDSVQKHIAGKNGWTDFRPEFKKVQKELRDGLLARMPEFDPSTPGFAARQAAASNQRGQTISLDSDDEEDDPAQSPTPMPGSNKRRAPSVAASTITPRSAKRMRTEGAVPVKGKLRFTIAEIENFHDLYASSDLACAQNPEVTDMIIKRSMSGWAEVTDDTLDKLGALLEDMVRKVLDKALRAYERCPLHKKTQDAINKFIQPLITAQKAGAKLLLDCELHKPQTFQDLHAHLNNQREHLYQLRNRKRVFEHFAMQEARGGKAISSEEKLKRSIDDAFVRSLGHDKHRGAVETLLLPFAYYQIAASRFVDNVSLFLEFNLLEVVKQKLRDDLPINIGIQDPANCEQMLMEDADLELQRQKLLTERAALQEAMVELNHLPDSTDA